MLQIGTTNKLKAFRKTDFGWMLINREADEVFLPLRFCTADIKVGDTISVFIYNDSEDRPVATTKIPLAEAGKFAFLRVKEVAEVGAFLDWGLEKDLFMPFREQKQRVEEGKNYLVYVYLDERTNRLVATTHIGRYLQQATKDLLKPNQEVELLIADDIGPGIRAIVVNAYVGLLFRNEIFGRSKPGDRVKGYVKKVRDDGKVDVALQKQGLAAAKDVKLLLLNKLNESGGELMLSDNSSPEEIYSKLGISKKNYKKAAGMLLKEGIIELRHDRIVMKRNRHK